MLYIYSAISFVLIVSLLLQIRQLHEHLTELARAVALANPMRSGDRPVAQPGDALPCTATNSEDPC